MAEKDLFRVMIKYSLIMAIVGLAVGVLYREFTKAYIAKFPLDNQILVSYYLSLSHGHVFVVGVLLPLALLVSTYMLLKIGYLDENRLSSLKRPFMIFIIGSLIMIGLLVYKGLSIVYFYAQSPEAGLTGADERLFLGSNILRESFYGIAHLLMGVGLIWYVLLLFRHSK